MTDAGFPQVSVGVVTHDRREVLAACLAALGGQRPAPAEVVVVDNGSTDGTVDFLRAHHPHVRVVALRENAGPAAARNRALAVARHDLVLLLDDDVLLEEGALARLVEALHRHRAAVAAPVIVLDDRPAEVQYAGFDVHVLCLGIARAGGVERADLRPAPYRVAAVAGGAMLVRRRVAALVGGFDERFVFGREDGEFCARVTQAGFHCLQVPAAAARHRWRPRGERHLVYQIRNRWLYMARLYSARTLVVAAPLLAAYEAGLALGLLCTGRLPAYLAAVAAAARAMPETMRARRATQALRRIPDAAWLGAGPVAPPRAFGLRAPLALAVRAGNAAADLYWRLVRPLLGGPAAARHPEELDRPGDVSAKDASRPLEPVAIRPAA